MIEAWLSGGTTPTKGMFEPKPLSFDELLPNPLLLELLLPNPFCVPLEDVLPLLPKAELDVLPKPESEPNPESEPKPVSSLPVLPVVPLLFEMAYIPLESVVVLPAPGPSREIGLPKKPSGCT